MHVEWIDDEAVVLDPKTGDLHYLNPTAAFVYALIEEVGYETMLERVRSTYGEKPFANDELPRLIEDMVEKGLLVDG